MSDTTSPSSERDWDRRWDVPGVLSYIKARKFRVVALQFPDELLKDAVLVTRKLQKLCDKHSLGTEIFLLADTTYNSLGVDEVAAAHVDAEAVVHFGRASLSAQSRLPAYFVFGHEPLDIAPCAQQIANYAAAPLNPGGLKCVLVILDQPCLWARSELQQAVSAACSQKPSSLPVVFAEAVATHLEPITGACPSKAATKTNSSTGGREDSGDACCSSSQEPSSYPACPSEPSLRRDATLDASTSCCAGYCWSFPEGTSAGDVVWLWVGPEDAPALLQLQMTHHDCEWAMYEPGEGRWQDGVPLSVTKSLRRRYYLVEKAKNAGIVGIVVGTLGVAGYLDAAERIRQIAQAAGKKTYTFLTGKPSPAKLANFPEVEVFVLVADPQGQILDSKEYFAPIITPFEAELAFTPGAQWGTEYRLDFGSLLLDDSARGASSSTAEEPRFSLLDGAYHGAAPEPSGSAPGSAVAQRPGQELLNLDPSKRHLIEVDSGASYLRARRSYQGLEAPVVGAEMKAAEPVREGRSGRAAHYAGESGS